MKDPLKVPECFLIREEPIRRLPRLVFAVSEACRRHGDAQPNIAALPDAIGAKCVLCGFALSGEELLALAGISNANEESAMLKRLRAGQCARVGCDASHYRLFFYAIPQINWPMLLSDSRPREDLRPESVPGQNRTAGRRIVLLKFAQIGGVIAVGFAAWLWWQWHSGGRIPFGRQPEHFHVTPGPDPARH